MDYQLLLQEQVLGNNSSATTGSNQLSQGGEQVKKVGKRLLSCLPRIILVDEGSNGQLSDIIEKLTIRQGQLRKSGSYLEDHSETAQDCLYMVLK